MNTSARYVEADDISEAWLKSVDGIIASGGKAVHLVTRIGSPAGEVVTVRRLANELLKEFGLAPVETVANTIFPVTWAQRFPEPSELAAYYRSQYSTIKRFQKHPGRETYFGRLVALASADGQSLDQLTGLVVKLRQAARRSSGRMSSRYEIEMADPELDLSVYRAGQDQAKLMGFPCLSLCSFHVAGDQLHLAAHYRNQYMIERCYGNYLGLSQLQRYVAAATSLEIGELLVVAGHADVERGTKARLAKLLKEATSALQENGSTSSGEVKRLVPNGTSRKNRYAG
jgi:hypothetical protein